MQIRLSRLIAAAVVTAAFAAPALADVGHSLAPEWGPDRIGGYPTTHIVVKFRPGVDPNALATADNLVLQGVNNKWNVSGINRLGPATYKHAAEAARIGVDRWYTINVPPGTNTPAMVQEYLQLQNLVEFAELDGIGGVALIPNDTNFNLQWDMMNTGQVVFGQSGVVDADVDATDAWDIHTGTSNITVAVVDSGVDPHPEFSARLMTGFNTVLNNTLTADACPHGTHVSGTVGALGNNASGVAGMSWGVNILPVRVLTGCSGNETDCGEGLMWGADNGANIETMSLQYYTGIQFFQDAVAYAHSAGVLLIAATGNNFGNTVAFPARFPFCMGVGATNNRDIIASFSNFGPECDLSAPGENVYSTWVGNSYTYLSGTSMATPHVSGLAALIWSFNPTLTNDQIESILKTTVNDLGPAGYDQQYGWGRINAFDAIQAAGGIPGTIPCGAINGFRGRCTTGIQTQVRLTSNLYNGLNVTIDVDGNQSLVPVVNNKVNLNLPSAPGSHTASLVDPTGCVTPVIFSCP